MLHLFKTGAAAAALLMISAASSQAAYVYVGSWNLATIGGAVYDASNPFWWQNNPQVYSALEAAAFLYGGSPSDYAISTIDENPANINHLAFVDGWGDSQYLINPASESFSLDSGAPGYNDPFGGPSFSALVTDHAPGGFPNAINYVFRDDSNAVPEGGSTIAMMGVGLVGLTALQRRLKKTVTA